MKSLIIFLIVLGFILISTQSGEQIELQDSWLAVTVLKTQYLEASQPVPIGGMRETKEYTEINLVYPIWEISLPLFCQKITQNYHSYHRAIDYISCESNILSIAGGEIILAKWVNAYGYRVELLHDNGMISTYSHLSEMVFEVGQKVDMGVTIGIMGSTGFSTGAHLHFEIIYQGIKINPNVYLK